MTYALMRTISAACATLFLMGCGQNPAAPSTTEPASEPPNGQSAVINPPSMAIQIMDDGAVSGAGSSAADDKFERGRVLYQRQCGACHSLDQNRVGPKHRGVVGRVSGVVSDYRYSPALQDLDLIWTAETLDAWLENPSQVAPGTAMGFGLRDADDRAAIIEYLESVSLEP